MTQLLLKIQLISLLFLFCGYLSQNYEICALDLEDGGNEDSDESNSSEYRTKDEIYDLERKYRRNTDERNKFRCPRPFGAFTDKQDCSFYYKCFLHIANRNKCPPNNNFDRFRKQCLPSTLAVCDTGTDVQTTDATIVSTTKQDEFRCPGWIGHFPHQIKCFMYYDCRLFIPFLRYCPDGTLFDALGKYCKPESDVDCGSREKQTTPQPSTTEEQTDQPTSTHSPKLTGPPGTNCPPDDLDCIIKDTGEISEWFQCPDGMGSFPHPSSAKLFIFCRNGKPGVKKCGQNRIFSIQTKICIMANKL